MSTPEVNGGVSRCGRVRKKTAKLMEMEEIESVPTATTERPTVRPALCTPQSSRSSKKKPAKLKITIAGEEVLSDDHSIGEGEYVPVLDSFECEEVVTEELIEAVVEQPVAAKTIPTLKIKFNASKGTAELGDRTNTHPVKRKASPPNGSEASERKKATKSPAQRAAPLPVTSNHINHSDHLNLNHSSNHSSDHVIVNDPVFARQEPAVAPKTEPKKRTGSAKAAKVSKATPGATPKRTNVTAYTLWCKENRPKVQKANPEMDFAAASRALGEIWQSLSNSEKLQWKLKAEKLKNGPVMMRDTGPPVNESTVRNHAPVHAPNSVRTASAPPHQPVRRIASSTKATVRVVKTPAASVQVGESGQLTPVRLSSYLRVLGESLSMLGRRLTDQKDQVADSRTLSPILDSTLCALAPLLALTTLDPRLNGCDPSTHTQTLEHISYIMPGI